MSLFLGVGYKNIIYNVNWVVALGMSLFVPFGYVAKRTFSANGLSNWLLPTNEAIMYLTVLIVLRTCKFN